MVFPDDFVSGVQKRFPHFFCSFAYNAGTDKQAPVMNMSLQGSGERYDNIGNNICDADITGFVRLFQEVSLNNCDCILHMIMRYIL